MAKKHGKDTFVSVGGADISTYCNNSELSRTGDSHDTTGYSPAGDAHEYEGGLVDGKFTCSGVYDSTAVTGPRAVLEPKLATKTPVIRRPEGTGAGKPEDSFQGLLTSYVETSPVADMVTWSAEFQVSGAVTSAAQV